MKNNPQENKNERQVAYHKVQGMTKDHSLAVILPKSYALNIGLKKGGFVRIYPEAERIIIEKV